MNKMHIQSAILLLTITLVSCDRHDTMNDAVIVGKMAPHVYWEPGSSNVNAGNNVPFMVQYYTTSDIEPDRLEVWYNVMEEESKSVICPWTQTFNFSITSNRLTQKRIPQKISSYNHQETYWNDSLRAYSFNAAFPTSNTLSTVSWIKPTTYDNDRMVAYFGANFAQQFKDSLFKLMKVTDFQKMYLGLNLVDNFKIYLDSTWNNNSGSWVYHFPKDGQGNTPVPQTIINIYQNIPFSDLVFNGSTNLYEIEYNRSYRLRANIMAFDKAGTAGISQDFEISLN